MSFIKNQEAICDYGYVELAIDFGGRKTMEEILAFAKRLEQELTATSNGFHSVEIKTVDIGHPAD
jgi:hypothetical protein